jgi:hypothetical protein
MMRLIAVFIALIAVPAAAAAEVKSACKSLLGTYLTINTAKDENVTSRSLLTFATGGLALFTDSGQSGKEGFAPFTAGRGTWRCITADGGMIKVKTTTLDFIAPVKGAKGEIGRLDFELNYHTGKKTIDGTATLYRVPLDADPFAADQLKDGDQFEINGQRVEAP